MSWQGKMSSFKPPFHRRASRLDAWTHSLCHKHNAFWPRYLITHFSFLCRWYITLHAERISACISACLSDPAAWMKENHLQLNLLKTEVLAVPAHRSMNHHTNINIVSTTTPTKFTKNLSVIVDDVIHLLTMLLQFFSHIALCSTTCRKVGSFQIQHAAQLLVQVVVNSCLNSCSALLNVILIYYVSVTWFPF